MIIHALYRYYETLLNDPDSGISKPGYSRGKVSHALLLSQEGHLLEVIDLRVERNNKLVSREMNVPEQVKRAAGIAANFLCDNCSYVLGLARKEKGKKDRSQEHFVAFKKLHEEILSRVQDAGALAVIRFLQHWDPVQAGSHSLIAAKLDELTAGGNLVFRLEGMEGYIHERPAIKQAWESYRVQQESEYNSQCLVTGKIMPIARLHPSIKGVKGAQSSGASLVSFNLTAFTSYGKTQSFNAPVSDEVAFGYTTALNYLLAKEKHRIGIGDTTTIFWAEKTSGGLEEDLLKALFNPEIYTSTQENNEISNKDLAQRDPRTVQLLRDIFLRIKNGKPVLTGMSEIDPDVTFYILGLAPNASRLSVRYWHVDAFGNLIKKIGQHYADLSIIKSYESEPDFISVRRILKEIAPLGDIERVPPLLGGALMRSILTGLPYPQVLYSAMISRIRADQKINYARVAVIKASLVRNQRFSKKRNEVITMSLDENNQNVAYRLGRTFALLEKAQEDANPGLNATIKDRYFGSASASPGSVFPILLRLAQHHITKAEYGRSIDKRIEEVLQGIDDFPSHLSLRDQGLFVLGYYHQRQALYQKNQKKEG